MTLSNYKDSSGTRLDCNNCQAISISRASRGRSTVAELGNVVGVGSNPDQTELGVDRLEKFILVSFLLFI